MIILAGRPWPVFSALGTTPLSDIQTLSPVIDLDARAAFLEALIAKAADRALQGFLQREEGQLDMKGPQDFLTETDLAVEDLIRQEIAHTFPEDAILGEEGGGIPGRATWVIDPVDGTANFARGVPHFCVIIAFCVDGRCELGAITNPVLNERYFARRGHGALKNGQPMRVTTTLAASSACLEMGWSRRLPVETYLEAQRKVLEEGANIRRGGSGGLALAYVAEGRSDGYFEGIMSSWDCLAGLLMVEEAGGRIGTWPATVADLTATGPVLAITPALADQFAKVLAPVTLKEASA
ncbi:inositol monophosphatase [Donghicola sp. B5-SW-15]|uniref:Inositol-1-monophosphatase n=1 Tax=Donghicola mangrovi TaxID=2729614 RepID=A0A850Q8Q4_9RHOB|nr:inositol monophosphatase [Donghicola mangrovi]